MDPLTSESAGEFVRVVYVNRTAAKQVKNRLEADGMLHRDFRITNGGAEGGVAVPIMIHDEAYEARLLSSGFEGVQGFGVHICPYSSAVLGNRNRLRRYNVSDSDERLTLVQSGLVRAMASFLAENGASGPDSDLVRKIRTLSVEVCPLKLELLGDDRTVVVPLRAFDRHNVSFCSLLDSTGASFNDFTSNHLWMYLAEIHNSSRVVRRGEVDPNSPVRKSGFFMLWTSQSRYSAGTGPGSSTWITVTEQGIRQSFDLTRIMFSRGNVSEKIRFGKLVKAGEMVLDMYAGIGYFTLPALVHGKARHVYCCEWNEDAADALRINLQDNGVQDRATVLTGDCRVTLLEQEQKMHGKFDRVSLGLLPSSEGGWRTAVRAVRSDTGGWLHVHGNVPVHENQQWTLWLCSRLRDFCRELGKDWVVVATHVEKVKSFAPNVNHYVADVFVGPLDCFLAGDDSASLALKSMSTFAPGFVGILKDDGHFDICYDERATSPSCALSPIGVLHQAWMRSDQ